jgi:O-antigen ligase
MSTLIHPAAQAAWSRPFVIVARATHTEFRFMLLACWLLLPTALSLPGRGGPLDLGAFDAVAIIKVILRGATFALLGLLVLRLNSSSRTQAVLRQVAPLALFAAWCGISFLWSPMKTVSLGHAMELTTMVLLVICAGILVDTEERLKTLLYHLFLTLFSMVLLILILEAPVILAGERPAGYMHPNALGAISATALFLLLACYFLWTWRWTRILLAPGVTVCLAATFLARSRSSFLVAIVLGILFWTCRRRALLVFALFSGGALMALLPYAKTVANLPDTTESYLLRGQTQDDLMGASGRDELWALALNSFRESPLLGHGYYMLSSSGSMFVWLKQQYQTAHNLGLHVLTGTGVIGALLFLWGFGVALAPIVRLRREKLMFLMLLLVVWFLLVGFFELSILGPVDPAGVTFFAILGAAMALRPSAGGQPQCAY